MAPRPMLSIPAAGLRSLWLRAQRLGPEPAFGAGPEAVVAAVAHLGYVQIDTINVIERCHHHILWNRIPAYSRDDLHAAQSRDRSIFEYWAHALAYLPAADWRFVLPAMRRVREAPGQSYAAVTPEMVRGLIKRIRDDGPLTIRDIDDDVLVEKDHPWASRKPSKRALQLAFFQGLLTISARAGMVKTYELPARHFGWTTPPSPATVRQIVAWRLDRALRSQAIVSLDSVCHLDAPAKPAVLAEIERRVRQRRLRPVSVEGAKAPHWADPAALEHLTAPVAPAVHILSPFDPLIIQRRRLALAFGYDHRFEAYVPADKRVMGYFALPVLVGDAVVAALDLKTDRAGKALLVRRWTWVGTGAPATHKAPIEEALHRFERFQLAAVVAPEP